MKTYDVGIIGGGVVGTSIARELSRYRLKIVLFEKEEELTFGVSKSNSGIIHPGTQESPGSIKGKLCVKGNILTRHVAFELGARFEEVGELIAATTEEEAARLTELKQKAALLGVAGLEIVGRDWLKKNEPNLSSGVIAALYAPTAGIISPYRLVYDLAENAVRNGAEVYTSAAVMKIDALRTGEPRGARFRVFTAKGVFMTRYLVNAAGLFADDVSRMAGIGGFTINPRKGEEFILDKKKENLTNHLIFPLPGKTSKGILVIKTADGNPMIGPTAEEVESKFDFSTSDKGLEEALSGAQRLVPSISGKDIIAYFAGLRPAAGDDFIIRHEDGAPGFVNAAGIQSPGLTAAPAIAAMVRGILKDNGLIIRKKALFRAHRKKTVHLFDVPAGETKKLIKKDPEYGDIVCRCEMVSAREVKDAVKRGACTLDGVKFRTRAQAGRCHGSFCTGRIMKIVAAEKHIPVTEVTKRGKGSEIVVEERASD